MKSTTIGAVTAVPLTAGLVQARADNHAEHGAWNEILTGHKIERIEFRSVNDRYPRLVGRNSGKGVHGYGGDRPALIVHTDRGAMGWGYAPGANKDQAHNLSNQFQDKPLTNLLNTATGIRDSVHKQLDFALHDLAGNILGIPVYKMLGDKGPDKVPTYSGMVYFDDIEPLDKPPGIEQVLFNAGADRAFGYRQMKIKVGRGRQWMEHGAGLTRDIEVTRELAKTYPDVTFLADANDGFSLQDTFDYLDGIGDVELLFMEEPFRENIDGFTKLRKYLKDSGKKTYIADGEADPNQRELDDLIARGLLDVHLTDTWGLGFTNWRRLLPSLEKRGVLTSPHTWGTRLKTVYTAHLAWGLGNTLTVEGVTCFSKDIDYSLYNPDQEGNLVKNDAPGFGLKLK